MLRYLCIFYLLYLYYTYLSIFYFFEKFVMVFLTQKFRIQNKRR